MAFLIGIALALAVFLFARLSGFDRDRAFYPTVTIVVAHYYVLFAVMGGGQGLGPELLVMALFAAAAVAGFKTSLWLVAAALAGHGAFDLVHARLIDNPGVPAFWPMFCMSYDVMAGACLAWLLIRKPGDAKMRHGVRV